MIPCNRLYFLRLESFGFLLGSSDCFGLQSSLKKEAACSSVEEQQKDKEAIEAEHAAAHAKQAENEAMVRWGRSEGFLGG